MNKLLQALTWPYRRFIRKHGTYEFIMPKLTGKIIPNVVPRPNVTIERWDVRDENAE